MEPHRCYSGDFLIPTLLSISLEAALGNDDGMTMTTKWMVTELSVQIMPII